MIVVKYFASLEQELGRSEDAVDAAAVNTVKDVWHAVAGDKPLAKVLCAVNQEYAQADTAVGDGDEVAFFPPVTGG